MASSRGNLGSDMPLSMGQTWRYYTTAACPYERGSIFLLIPCNNEVGDMFEVVGITIDLAQEA